MSDIASRLRQTRADMLGTPDETHYWDCAAAADEIERLCKALDTAEENRETYKAMSLRETMENARLRAENDKLRAALLVIENYARGSLNDSAALKETGE